jgi:hypothetical protein
MWKLLSYGLIRGIGYRYCDLVICSTMTPEVTEMMAFQMVTVRKWRLFSLFPLVSLSGRVDGVDLFERTTE